MAFCAWCANPVPEVSYAACPRCGNPSNGAQRAGASPANSSKSAGIVIAVIVGGFFLVAVLGILAAIAIPNLLTAMQRSRQKRTMADMRSVAVALESYAAEENRYPRVTAMLELSPALSPKYIPALPAVDGWGTAWKYECWPAEGACTKYAIGSAGADKVWEHESLQEYVIGTTTQDFDADVVFANGQFAQYPQGLQGGK